MPNDEMSQYLGVFLDEANEQLELLEQTILVLEHGATTELLQQIFRAAHTLKGSSRAMDFNHMGELTHAMEDVLDKLRNDELEVNLPIIDALLGGLDTLKNMVEEIAASGNTTINADRQTERLREVMVGVPGSTADPIASIPIAANSKASGFNHAPLSVEARAAVAAAIDTGLNVYEVTVTIASDCAMKSVRALMALQDAERHGSLLSTTPDEDTIENEEFDFTFGFVYATATTAGEVQNRALQVAEITSVKVESLDKSAKASEADFISMCNMTEAAKLAAEAAQTTGQNIYSLDIAISRDCVMRSVRALMVLQSLEVSGSVLATVPGEEAIENEEFDFAFQVVIATDRNAEEIVAQVSRTSEIESVRIEPLKQGSIKLESATTVVSSAEAPITSTIVNVVEDERVVDAGREARGLAPEVVAKKAQAAPAQQAQTVRVDVVRLDKLLNLVGELVIDQTRIAQVSGRLSNSSHENSPLLETLQEAAAHFGRITSELQEEIMKARMLPIDNVFNRFPRMIRDMTQKLGKEIDFVVEGKETELDRSVIEVIGDPLIHILRNSVDHGVEMPDDREASGKARKGTVWLRARHEENYIVIQIEDDGRGIDADKLRAAAVKKELMTAEAAARLTEKEAINLIFASGFSTAKAVTDISGRGVGMDIVRSNLTRLGALIDIETKVGKGSTFTIKLPLTLAIIRGLLVNVGSGVFAVPLASVVETVRILSSEVHTVNHREVILQRGSTLPLLRLNRLFGTHSATPSAGSLDPDPSVSTDFAVVSGSHAKRDELHYVVVVGVGERRFGIVVDSLLGEQEVVIKSLGKFIGDLHGISGATILGDGRIALIVDVNGLLTIATEERVEVYAA